MEGLATYTVGEGQLLLDRELGSHVPKVILIYDAHLRSSFF